MIKNYCFVISLILIASSIGSCASKVKITENTTCENNFVSDSLKTYFDSEFAYTFKYPSNFSLITFKDSSVNSFRAFNDYGDYHIATTMMFVHENENMEAAAKRFLDEKYTNKKVTQWDTFSTSKIDAPMISANLYIYQSGEGYPRTGSLVIDFYYFKPSNTLVVVEALDYCRDKGKENLHYLFELNRYLK